ncbi:MAG: metal-dependent hydrolase [Planctomycetota bacterium]
MDLITHGLAGASIGVATSNLIGDGSPQPELIVSATIASLLPDLDFIFAIANKPLLAWRWHRVLLHNVFVVPLLALLAACFTHLLFGELPFLTLVWCNAIAVFAHLFLDLLTSFRTGIFFPFSDRRFALGTHFLSDPLIGILCALSLVPTWNGYVLFLLACYLLVAVALKNSARIVARKQQLRLGLETHRLHLRPRILAPWRWLAIIEEDSQYVFFYVTPMQADRAETTSRGIETLAAKLSGNHELLRYFRSLADFPRYEDTERDGLPAIVVEDIQWWWKLPFRPMAMSAILDADQNPKAVRESNKFSTSPTG